MPESSPSVLLIRLDAVGDALALVPLLAALRARGIPVDVVLTERNYDALSPFAARRRYAWPLRPGEQLGSYSHALVATEDALGYRLARASGANERIGFENGWGKPLKTLWARSLLTHTVHRTAGLDGRSPHECEVLFRLGADLLGDDARPTRDAAALRPLVLEAEPAPDDRIVFQVTEKWDRLGLRFDDVVACARRLAGYVEATLPHDARGDRPVIRCVGSVREGAYVQRFTRVTSLHVERFDALPPWKAAIGAARALVAPDSGAIHVAGMVGTPTVAVFPPMRSFAVQTARWSPWAAPFRIVAGSGDWPRQAVDALRALTGTSSSERA